MSLVKAAKQMLLLNVTVKAHRGERMQERPPVSKTHADTICPLKSSNEIDMSMRRPSNSLGSCKLIHEAA